MGPDLLTNKVIPKFCCQCEKSV